MLYTGRLHKRAFRIIPVNIIDFFIFQLSAMENVGASTLTVKSTIPLRPVLPLHNNKKHRLKAHKICDYNLCYKI